MSYRSFSRFSRRIVHSMIAATVTLAPAVAMQPAFAQPPSYWLVLHGSKDTQTSYINGYLEVQFRHSPRPAGTTGDFDARLPRGTAAWQDRPMARNEPMAVRQQLSYDAALNVVRELRSGGYWMFDCYNTNEGYLLASMSRQTSAAVRID
ncbi:hypothetical protein [Caballeronia sp. ATUFL_M2_KS44]|uniref:hypothetical protein n=1 Tax=Caballeronia sp. ATUFL_M2_KS44 TaxID=2921767 RepID=UPI0020289B11|nr:hypothetical protein [Caballeronia sp. ATUFL_M2_KS44]